MVSLSTSLVLTYAILQTQTVTSQVSQNALRTDLAAQAAQTGAAGALARMQSPDWQGVSVPLYQTIYSDGDGTASYTVTFQKYPPQPTHTVSVTTGMLDSFESSVTISTSNTTTSSTPTATSSISMTATAAESETIPGDPALVVLVSSQGLWQSSHDSQQKATRTVEVLVNLEPRLPGRGIVSADYATAEDVAANPGDFDQIQTHALCASRKDEGYSLVFDPQHRFDGQVWVERKISAYRGSKWSTTARNVVLQDLAAKYVTTNKNVLTVQHPHPFGGPVTFSRQPDTNSRNDLAALGIPWTQVENKWNWPTINYSEWQQYQLYQGGFSYRADTLSSTLQNITLRPSETNPLGVFYARGSITLGHDVTIQGTLVSEGTVNVIGNRVRVGSYNWRDGEGAGQVGDVDFVPRLPAIVARDVVFGRDSTAIVEGAVVVDRSVTGAGGQYELTANTFGQLLSAEITGSATARPLQQPQSKVSVNKSSELNAITGGELFAIWLADGASGTWYPISAVNAAEKTLTVIGEARFDSPTPFRIKSIRKRSVDIRGPVVCAWFNFECPDAWANLTSSQWNTLYTNWQAAVAAAPKNTVPIRFLDYLAVPQNFGVLGSSFSYSQSAYSTWYSHLLRYGLTVEPTLHVRPISRVSYRWSPPLFEPYKGTADNGKHAGYRWKVLSWREIEGT
ncbi:MAG: hypothetical protein HZA46_15075 [Planctomycetales bacterium]|nr:hypothetical protein [Planctomycetales bacterium]